VRTASTAALVLVVLLTGGCSGDEASAKAGRSGTQWVNAVCTDLGRWIDAVTPGSDGSAVTGTVVSSAARRLQNAVEELQPPATDDGNAAQGEIERLVEGIRAGADQTATTTLIGQVRRSVDGIRNLTPGGVLEREFSRAPACELVRG
jgi:hypothetical protein